MIFNYIKVTIIDYIKVGNRNSGVSEAQSGGRGRLDQE